MKHSIKNKLFYLIIPFSFMFCGFIFLLIQKDLLIVNLSFGSIISDDVVDQTKKDIALKKKVKLYYQRGEQFLYEEKALVWFSDKSENLKHLINSWLLFLYGERIIGKNIYLESVGLDKKGLQVYLSFDVTPIDREWSIFKKWRFVESLFKTIRDSGLGIRFIVFMSGHNTLEDDHLDFSVPWPIEGFLDN